MLTGSLGTVEGCLYVCACAYINIPNQQLTINSPQLLQKKKILPKFYYISLSSPTGALFAPPAFSALHSHKARTPMEVFYILL